MQKTRQIKLQPHHRESRIVPELRLSGVWLEQLGFKAGEVVSITTRDNLLIIQPISEEEYEQRNYKELFNEARQTLKKLSS